MLDRVVVELSTVPGVDAIVLGGSRARGTHHAGSDVDVGIYYGDEAQLDYAALDLAATRLDDGHRDGLVAPPGSWGDWVNGGAWLTVQDTRVDLLLRETARVRRVIDASERGVITAHYQPGHPHAYINVMYRGELAICQVLHDLAGTVMGLKRVAETYPGVMKRAIIQRFSFEAEFSSVLAGTSVRSDDSYYTMAHLVRSVSCLNHVLFAINEQYCLNEKRAVRLIETFPVHPAGYTQTIDRILGAHTATLTERCEFLVHLVNDVKALIPDEVCPRLS